MAVRTLSLLGVLAFVWLLAFKPSIAADPELPVFTDALEEGWTNVSWDSSINLNNMTPTRSGSRSLAVTFNKGYAGLSLQAQEPINTGPYRAMRFWAHGGRDGARFAVAIQATPAGREGPRIEISVPANTWAQYTLELARLGQPATISRLNVLERSGTTQDTFYLDDLSLLPATAPAQPTTPNRSTAANVMGRWSAVKPWPVIAIHAALLPNGKLLTWGGGDNTMAPVGSPDAHDGNDTYVWDPMTDTQQLVRNTTTELFCAGTAFLPDGRLFVAGGHAGGTSGKPDTNLFDPQTNTWTRLPDMNAGRWYPSVTTLANGAPLVAGGWLEDGKTTNAIPQRWDGNRYRDLIGLTSNLPLYPWIHVAPDGRGFLAGPGPEMRFLDPNGQGAWSEDSIIRDDLERRYGVAVMYQPGKLLIAGGGDEPSETAVTVDLTQSGAVTGTASMSRPRRQHNATILPDGTVLITGGLSGPGFSDETQAVLTAELWNPTSNTFEVKASMKTPRLYHSVALLLPDGRVFTGGTGRGGDTKPHQDAEIYSPPYLFGPDGQPAKRPSIDKAPKSVWHAQAFNLETPNASSIKRVTMIRLSSVTHSLNTDQRFLELNFQRINNRTLAVTAPADGGQAPPGPYMLFVMDQAGVPSVAWMMQVR